MTFLQNTPSLIEIFVKQYSHFTVKKVKKKVFQFILIEFPITYVVVQMECEIGAN